MNAGQGASNRYELMASCGTDGWAQRRVARGVTDEDGTISSRLARGSLALGGCGLSTSGAAANTGRPMALKFGRTTRTGDRLPGPSCTRPASGRGCEKSALVAFCRRSVQGGTSRPGMQGRGPGRLSQDDRWL